MEIMFSYERDVRETKPDKNQRRKARFRKGWWDALAAMSDPKNGYTVATLKRLTWQNLGFRFGSFFGRATNCQINKLYDWCVEQQPNQATWMLSQTPKQPPEST